MNIQDLENIASKQNGLLKKITTAFKFLSF